MPQNQMLEKINKLYETFTKSVDYLRHPTLFIMRLYWGYKFFEAGKGKFGHIDKTVEFFQSINIPAAKLNVYLAASTEMIGGLLLLVGLGARLISIPLAFTMCIAYLTAESEELHAIFREPEKFIGAAPFLFLLTAVLVLIFGPGAISIDGIIKKVIGEKLKSNS